MLKSKASAGCLHWCLADYGMPIRGSDSLHLLPGIPSKVTKMLRPLAPINEDTLGG